MIGVVFVAAGLLIKNTEQSEVLLIPSYWIAAVLALSYLLYGATQAKAERQQEAIKQTTNEATN